MATAADKKIIKFINTSQYLFCSFQPEALVYYLTLAANKQTITSHEGTMTSNSSTLMMMYRAVQQIV